ncbi:hypothetical protein TNCV_4591941 [Trichonephila clavipes]|nr:hypothetical protein TNCV_4591941 [Trichonephila clavipes]
MALHDVLYLSFKLVRGVRGHLVCRRISDGDKQEDYSRHHCLSHLVIVLQSFPAFPSDCLVKTRTATAGSDVVQSGRPIFDVFFQHLWSYIGNNMANVVFQMVKRLWLIRIDQ